MRKTPESPGNEPRAEISSLRVLGARLSWVLVGPLALLATAWGIVSRRKAWLTGLDALFVAITGLMILARWVEQRSGAATTLTGEPATLAQCRQYTIVLLIVAAVAWIAAKVLDNFVLT